MSCLSKGFAKQTVASSDCTVYIHLIGMVRLIVTSIEMDRQPILPRENNNTISVSEILRIDEWSVHTV